MNNKIKSFSQINETRIYFLNILKYLQKNVLSLKYDLLFCQFFECNLLIVHYAVCIIKTLYSTIEYAVEKFTNTVCDCNAFTIIRINWVCCFKNG